MYLFIAKKDYSSDYCMGCHMASYHSDFELRNWLSREELIKVRSEYLHKNMNMRINEAEYEFYIFKQGIMLHGGDGYNGTCWDGGLRYGYNTDEYYEHFEELEKQEKEDREEFVLIVQEAKAIANGLQETMKAKEKQALAKRDELEVARAKEERRKRYEELKGEFKE
jgi:hypothetical protein